MDSTKRQNKQRKQELEAQVKEDSDEQKMKIEPIMYDKNEDQWEDEGDINVDFVFLDPNENQFSSVKMLINGYLDGLSYRSSELAEIIVNQAVIGTMVGTEDFDEDEPQYKTQFREQGVYGFITIINIQNYINKPVIQEVLNFILNKSQCHNTQENHQTLLQIIGGQKGKLGLLINERVINLVPQVIPVLHNQLVIKYSIVEDMNWLKKEDPKEWAIYQCEWLLVMTQTYKDQQINPTQKVFYLFPLQIYKIFISFYLKQKIKQKGSLPLKSLIYKKFDDYTFLTNCEFYFSYDALSSKSQSGLTNQQDKDQNEEICNKIIYLIKFEEYLKSVPHIQSVMQN